MKVKTVAVLVSVVVAGAGGAPAPVSGSSGQIAAVEIRPADPVVEVGETLQLEVAVRDTAGQLVPDAEAVFVSLARGAVTVTPTGLLRAFEPGEHRVMAIVPQRAIVPEHDRVSEDEPGVRAIVTVRVPLPPVERIDLSAVPTTLWTGTDTVAEAWAHDRGGRRDDVDLSLLTSDASVLEVDPVGQLRALRPGSVELTVEGGGVAATREITVRANPIRSLTLTASRQRARTGDVVVFEAAAADDDGDPVADVPITWAVAARPDPTTAESVGAGAPAQVARDGRFVAEQPGVYTVVATSGDSIARANVEIVPRDVQMDVEFVGQARVADRVTSDLWVWEGVDGRDYAAHGTWNAEGHAYFYDVTDPSNMVLVDRIQVDARTVNDVKVSEDGRTCVISREGASTRRNGIVILDCTDPRDVRILSTFDDQLTGGVHNVFIHDDHVYAVNNGRRWDVINIEDPTRPTRVARFQTDSPSPSVHDVWVRDGIAYQAGRTDGAVMVDVGGGGRGGSPSNPVEMGRLAQLTGWNHTAWPFRSPSTGKLYFVAGDEAFWPHPLAPAAGGILWREKLPSRARGWVHFLDFEDPQDPREVARYGVPDSGPHNYWIDWEEEILYVAHFDAGLRVVDISGELMGDLYRQGREIAKFYPDDPQGYTPNAPFVWGPQPHKGTIFFADFNSGLWAVRLVPPAEDDGSIP